MGGTGNFDRHCAFGENFNLGIVRLIIRRGDVQIISFLRGCTDCSPVDRIIFSSEVR